MFDKNKLLFSSSISDNNYYADYIRIMPDGATFLCRLDRSHIPGGGITMRPAQLLNQKAWQICLIVRHKIDVNNESISYYYPHGSKDYCFACDDEALHNMATDFIFAI